MEEKMSQEYVQLLDAIRQDDLALFSLHIEGNEDVSFGRFPVLSLIYLYNAKKLEKVYKSVLCKIANYRYIPEYFSITGEFRKRAGRVIRLYRGECIVSPLEMLAILHKDRYLKKCFKDFFHDEKIMEGLGKIYKMHSQKVIVSSLSIKIGTSPLTTKDIKKIRISTCFSLVCIVLLIGCYVLLGLTNGLGVSACPTRISTATQLLSALGSSNSYSLTCDVEIDNFESIDSFSGTLDGNHHTLYVHNLPNKYLLKENRGDIKNINIVYDDMDVEINTKLSLFVGENNGTINNVKIICNKFNFVCNKADNLDIFVTTLATTNNGDISSCEVVLNGTGIGKGNGECSVSAFAGINNGVISNCVWKSGTLSCTDIDLAGIVATNNKNGIISMCKNYCKLYQLCTLKDWSPNVSGISTFNYGEINNSYNYADLSIKSSVKDDVSGVVYIAGICANNSGDIISCLSNGDIDVTSDVMEIYAGGITAFFKSTGEEFSVIDGCGSNGKINLKIEDDGSRIIAGGICGCFVIGKLSNNYSLSTFSTGYNANKYLIGGATGGIYVELYFYLYYYMCGELNNNYVFVGDNLESANGGYFMSSSDGLTFKDSLEFDMVSNGFTAVSTAEDLKGMGVYWYE